jgi:hypothetical protein
MSVGSLPAKKGLIGPVGFMKDRSKLALTLTIFVLVIAAAFYLPLGNALLGFLKFGAAGAAVYITFRYPWDVLYWGSAFTLLGVTLVALLVGFKTGGAVVGIAAYLASTFIMIKIVEPLRDWIEGKRKGGDN